jgi:hypothetical protein
MLLAQNDFLLNSLLCSVKILFKMASTSAGLNKRVKGKDTSSYLKDNVLLLTQIK